MIYDLNRFRYYPIPNSLKDILLEYEGFTIDKVLNKYFYNERSMVLEYFHFLIEKEIIFFPPKQVFDNFIDYEYHWDNPSFFSNAIVDVNSTHDWRILFSEFCLVKCKHIQIRFKDISHFYDFLNYIDFAIDSSISSIEVYIPYKNELEYCFLKELQQKYQIIVRYFIYSAPFSEFMRICSSTQVHFIQKSRQTLFKLNKVKPSSFQVEFSQFIEALNHNIYFNRKVFIGENGEIKMSPHAAEVFGNIYQNSLISIWNVSDFKRYWYISKDNMYKCKDCELRYMCTFEAVPIFDIEIGLYRYNEECGYNPYTASFN
jgi:SPASM domain peptide maturase of grasp-with-spasm system